MKIVCIGRNYVEHIKELNNTIPDEPLFFLKPDTAVIKNNAPFFYPDFSKDIQYEVELLVKINRVGKNIKSQFSYKYYDSIGLGLDLTARDIQQQCKKKGHPWEKAKAFDGSAIIGEFIPMSSLPNPNEIQFSLTKNGELVQEGNSKNMIHKIDDLISYISGFITLKVGDIIFTGTPAGVGPIEIGDQLKGSIENTKRLEVTVK